MAQPLEILPPAHFADAMTLADALGGLYYDKRLTGSQSSALLMLARPALPCVVALAQRKPRGVLWAQVGDRAFGLDRAGNVRMK